MKNDNNKEEIEKICTVLLNYGKLKRKEFILVSDIYLKNITERITKQERDKIIKLYDAIGEVGYS